MRQDQRPVLEACIELDSAPQVVRVVRQFVDHTVTEWELGSVREDARLVATELAANAVLHARTPVSGDPQIERLRLLEDRSA